MSTATENQQLANSSSLKAVVARHPVAAYLRGRLTYEPERAAVPRPAEAGGAVAQLRVQ